MWRGCKSRAMHRSEIPGAPACPGLRGRGDLASGDPELCGKPIPHDRQSISVYAVSWRRIDMRRTPDETHHTGRRTRCNAVAAWRSTHSDSPNKRGLATSGESASALGGSAPAYNARCRRSLSASRFLPELGACGANNGPDTTHSTSRHSRITRSSPTPSAERCSNGRQRISRWNGSRATGAPSRTAWSHGLARWSTAPIGSRSRTSARSPPSASSICS